jgi:hypothetical protein
MDLEQKLMKNYPSLFYADEDGSPTCSGGVWVPPGWESNIEELCGCISDYTRLVFVIKRKAANPQYYFWHYFKSVVESSHMVLIKKIAPCLNKNWFNSHINAFIRYIRNKELKCAKFYNEYPPAVKIDQIKEKFGGLRFYYTGGDKEVAGMVRLTEYLCERTCEVSGEKGELCSSGGWYKTLSSNARNTEIYKRFIPVKKDNS